jgi:type I restriction enzyme, S subunit
MDKMKYERLGNLVKNLDNKRIPLNSAERNTKSKKGTYPYIGANNIVTYINEFIFNEKILCVAEDGGSWGTEQVCANIYVGKTWVNNHAHVLIENGKSNLEYIRFYLNHANLNKHITGTTRGKLTRKELDNIRIPFPTHEDQIRVATILSKAEALIKQRKESIALLDEFLKSTFLEMFGDPVRNEKGWEINKLKKYFEDEPQNGLYKHGSEYGEGYRILRIDSFYNGAVIDLVKLKRVKLTQSEIDKYSLKQNDIIRLLLH